MSEAGPRTMRDLAADARLQRLVADADRLGEDFGGIGLVFCEAAEVVPHVPIYSGPLPGESSDVCALLVACSRLSTPRHDGFHLLSPDWRPLALGVFVAPPLPREPIANPGDHGSRWIAAALTARLPGVAACVTISRVDRTITIFRGERIERHAAPGARRALG